ncbi:DUF364 domain-containing protein [Parvibacter caecicola]|uniref:DUF364 domain-containing protein n=1 Tax=Parvibacter caecicola TaxID=747645 RepID=UPI0023F0ED47|nr:DUF364 domain-containing protein [Parvibacter caecicola]
MGCADESRCGADALGKGAGTRADAAAECAGAGTNAAAGSAGAPGAIAFPGTDGPCGPWRLYNHLIAGIPEDVAVRDYCLGTHWSYVTADSGTGVSFTTSGGAKRGYAGDLRGKPLREVAQLAKSWCFEEASLGVAALNVWYSQRALLDPLGCIYDAAVEVPDGTVRKMDAFEMWRPEITAAGDASVVVVGHFPHVERIEEYARLTVLERRCSQANDVPDPACEYVIPDADYLFMTGVTLINKTAPRLLDLAANTKTIMVGPSVVMAPLLFKWGVNMLAGSVVADPEKAAFAVKNGAGQFFGEALTMAALKRPEA